MRNFAAVPTQTYIGQPFSKPIQLGSISGMACPLTFNWLSYGAATANPNIAVNVDMSTSNVANRMGVLRSVFIDNTGSDVSIYVYFPDTQCVVPCQPNATAWAPVYTGTNKCQIIGLGFLDGDIPSTLVTFTNIPVTPAVNIELATAVALWKASPLITRGTGIQNTNFGVPALGDQVVTIPISFAALNQTVPLFGTPLPSGFVYLTHAFIYGYFPGAATNSYGWVLESTGASGNLFTYFALGNANSQTIVQSLQKMNLKLNATETWQLRATAVPNIFPTVNEFVFTINPT